MDGMTQLPDPLDAFLADFLAKAPVIGLVPLHGAVSYIEGVAAVLLYRGGQFQVQMFIVPPGHVIPEHTHPNVDSYEVYVGGQIKFSHGGRFIVADEDIAQPDQHGCASLRGQTIRVRPNDPHGGVFGPSGGVFLSVQHWLNGVAPHCVAADYEGVVMGPDHMAKVVNGLPRLKPTLSPADAATAETAHG